MMESKETKFEVLDELRESLVRDLQPDRHFAFLRSKRVLDQDDCEEINSKVTSRKKSEMFLDILRTKGERGFDYFCESFLQCGKTQLHLLNQILDAFEDKLYESEVESSSRPQQECIDTEILNRSLPCPGEAGAPCLPNAPYLPMVNGLQPEMNGQTLLSNYDMTLPPPYSTH